MIEPYGAIIQSMLRQFPELGLAIERDTDYITRLANGDYALIIATERSSQPAVLASFVDRAGSTFEIGLAERILAGPKLKSRARKPDEIVGRDQLDIAGAGGHVQAGDAHAHIRLAVWQIFNFVAGFQQEMLAEDGPFRAEYQAREQQLLNELGL